jgi:hypothetical protein
MGRIQALCGLEKKEDWKDKRRIVNHSIVFRIGVFYEILLLERRCV